MARRFSGKRPEDQPIFTNPTDLDFEKRRLFFPTIYSATPAPPPAFKTGRAATYVVAASDAPGHVKAQADYVCDGTDDHVQIQAAIDALPATGGKVLLTEGTFNIETSITLDTSQTLQGMGRSTILTTTTADLDIITATGSSGSEKVGILIADLCIDGDAGSATNDCGIVWTYVDNSDIMNVTSKDNGEEGIFLDHCDWNTIFNCLCSGQTSAYYTGIKLEDSNNNTVNQNRCTGNYWGIWLYTANNNIVVNNVCSNNTNHGIILSGGEDNNVSVNVCNNNGGRGMSIDGYRNTLEGNICNSNTEDGLALEDSNQFSIVSNNICSINGYHGLYLDNLIDCIVIGNTCAENSQDTTNTYDAIFISVTTDSYIGNNICRAGDLTNKSRYGINISDASSTNNKVINNDLYDDGFGTAPYNDSGTDTIYLEPEDTRDFLKYFGNRTLFSGGTISAHGDADGSVAIAACTAWSKETDADSADGVFFSYAGKAKQTLTDQQVNFICLDYNAGTPQIVVDTALLTYSLKLDHILLGAVFRDDTTVHIHNVDHIGIGGISRSNLHWTEHFMVHRVSGAVTSSTGTRQLVVTAGVVYAGLTRNATNAFNTNNGDTFTYWYSTDGGTTWVKVEPASTAIDNVQFNDMSDPYGLDDLGEAKYGVHWVYLDNDGIHLHVVYGQDSYNANQAEEAGIPVSLPSLVTNYCVLIAKIIVQKSQPTLVITYPWTTVFTSSLATDHGSLGGLADDDHAQYLLASGARALAGDLDGGGHKIHDIVSSYAKKTTNYTTTVDDEFIAVGTTFGAVTITLGSAACRAGQTIIIKDIEGGSETNAITIATEGAELIDSAATDTINRNSFSKQYYSDGSNWFSYSLTDDHDVFGLLDLGTFANLPSPGINGRLYYAYDTYILYRDNGFAWGAILQLVGLENPPTEDESVKAPTSEWAFDHDAAITGVHGAGAGTLLATPLTADMDFAKYKAIALVCDKGATMPADPTDGQWYLHTPTGRMILYQYNSTWIAIISVGSMTVYVDKTDGTDDLNHGTAVDGDAFATVQYAVDCIPGLVGGNVVINVNGEAYAESLVVRGKNFTGNFSIKICGILSQQDTATLDSAVQGTGATQGSVTDTGKFAAFADMLILAHGEYRLIDSVTADVATIVGCFTGVPSGTWVVYDWGTTINKLLIAEGQLNVLVYDIEFDTTTAVTVSSFATLACHRCKITGSTAVTGKVITDTCYIGSASHVCRISKFGYHSCPRSKIYIPMASRSGFYVEGQGQGSLTAGSVVDSASKTSTNGAFCETNAFLQCYQTAAAGYIRIRNCDKGIFCKNGGITKNTSNNQYLNNNNNEDAEAASFGYID